MIYNDLLRQILIVLMGLSFLFYLIWTLIKPDSFAQLLGYKLDSINAKSEFHAIYVGVFFAHVFLAYYSFVHLKEAAFADFLALFVLMQPIGRLISVLKSGFPNKAMCILFAMELSGSVLLLLVRPVI